MLVGFFVQYFVIGVLFMIHGAFSEWKLSCYNERLTIECEYHSRIVVHESHFGFFEKTPAEVFKNYTCFSDKHGDCAIDVSRYISNLCSGLSSCTTNVHYSVGLSHDSLAKACPMFSALKPSLFVEYDCISDTLFTKLSATSRVDSEQVGGYLTTLDYTESIHGGVEWRSHLAEALCQTGHEQLPVRFYLPAPKLHNQQDPVTFILRLKDISLTYPGEKVGSGQLHYSLSTDLDCLIQEKPCHQDYLEISAKLPSTSRLSTGDGDSSGVQTETERELILPVARFCLMNSTDGQMIKSKTGTNTHEDSIHSELIYGAPSSQIGRVYGPLPPAHGLNFISNLNLLNTGRNLMLGKGILIEYIALFCTPINPPSGKGFVDYRFFAQPHSTVAYAEIFCPPGRWLEPQPPDNQTPLMELVNHTNTWWLERRRHTRHVCDHHQKSWSPNRIPVACLTESELIAFVANVEMLMHNPTSSNLTPLTPTVDHTVNSLISAPASVNQSRIGVHTPLSVSADHGSNTSQTHSGSSIAIGTVLGFLVCLLVVLLIVYSLRHKLVAHYHKTVSFPIMSDRLTRSSSTFNPSMHSVYPTVNSADWRRKWAKSRWDFFKPWRTHTWSQNLNGTYPDLPKQTLIQGTFSTGHKTPETMVIRRSSAPLWRIPGQPTAQSAFSLIPGTPGMQHFNSSQPAINGSPWLKTTSTTRLTQQPVNYMNSSGDISSPTEGYLLDHAWWLPWRRSLKKQRRLHMHLQRRREVQYQSQRRLMESSGNSNVSSMQFAFSPSTVGSLQSGSRDSNGLIEPRPMTLIPNTERPLSQRTTRSSRTFTTSDGGTATSGCAEPVSQPAHAINTTTTASDLPHLSYTNWDFNDATSGHTPLQPYPEFQPTMERQISTGGDTLPWKSTPPTTNSISNGFRRFSSFLRNLNGSLTPPKSSRRSQSQLIRQIHPQSMSTLDSPNYCQTSPMEFNNQNGANVFAGRMACVPFTPSHGFPRAKSESGSIRLGRRLGLRSLFNIPMPRDGPNMSRSDMEDSITSPDPTSGSTTTTTRTSVTHIAPTGLRPEDWSQYPDWCASGVSGASTICGLVPQYAPATPPPHLSALSVATRPHFFFHPAGPVPVSVVQANPLRGSPYSPMPLSDNRPPLEQENSHFNDPYLEPVSVKRVREGAISNVTTKALQSSDSDAQPSATSSAISSLVFADSVAEDEPEADTQGTIQSTSLTSQSNSNHTSDHVTTQSVAVPRALDYVTYDLTRSGVGVSQPQNATSQAPGTKPYSGLIGDLFATQVGIDATQIGHLGPVRRRSKRDANQVEIDPSSRPLSEAMISNHYYDANELGVFYPEGSTQVAPVPPPRVDLMIPHQTPPNLPPLWDYNRPGIPLESRPTMPMARDMCGSMDSLYETVDQFRGQNFDAIEIGRSNSVTTTQQGGDHQTIVSGLINNSNSTSVRLPQDTLLQRQHMALPPTPDSMDCVRAPMATSDEVSDTE